MQVDSEDSLVVINVFRSGPLSAMGHDHVISSRSISGCVSMAKGVADLRVPLEDLVVDDPELRRQAGLERQPSAKDVEATRTNMLERALDYKHFPDVLIHAIRSGPDPSLLSVAITLHGTSRHYAVPAKIDTSQNRITVDGSMSFNQTDFGIVPLAVLAGALQVRDQLTMRFHIVAHDP
jgi:hypothetical protein